MLRVVRGDDRRSWGILAGRFRRPIDPGGCWERFGPWWPLDDGRRATELLISGGGTGEA